MSIDLPAMTTGNAWQAIGDTVFSLRGETDVVKIANKRRLSRSRKSRDIVIFERQAVCTLTRELCRNWCGA